ncbi:hypothetical protein C8J56DRAFT_1048273 [Mycena floridula]|nr:hypothetical protein C8J56DRAFT_1048273 [Mycena floridula]
MTDRMQCSFPFQGLTKSRRATTGLCRFRLSAYQNDDPDNFIRIDIASCCSSPSPRSGARNLFSTSGFVQPNAASSHFTSALIVPSSFSTESPLATGLSAKPAHEEVKYLPSVLWRVFVIRAAAHSLVTLNWPDDGAITHLATISLPKLTSLTLGIERGITTSHSSKFSTNVLFCATAAEVNHDQLQTLDYKLSSPDDEADFNDTLQSVMNSLTAPALVRLSVDVMYTWVPVAWPQQRSG